ncbi:MAG: VTT domain-containing protein [Phenylobacterium sp.]|uniref:TVP38/TMEM64 family protein n=1 Tax=Phenylobacterium sp. TaxID=1871053 RepID=UPI002721CAB8|nr:VTT domain-containing protein [Phenylobacterium sp.]MDO8410474.1 VTT domain-containing protein [Phenylobacterium sp.]
MPPDQGPRRRTVVVALAVLSLVTLLGFAAPLLPLGDAEALALTVDRMNDGRLAPLCGVAIFAGLATVGVPQFVLISALVLVFGPWAGFAYSWTGKMIACAMGFFVGRRFGAQLVAQYQSPALAAFMAGLARRGFWVSAGIRLAPTVPSVVINIAAGATPIGFSPFIAGAGVGSLPKMALMVFGGAALIRGLRTGSVGAWGGVALAILLFGLMALGVRAWRARRLG